jgi:hypothetical protein
MKREYKTILFLSIEIIFFHSNISEFLLDLINLDIFIERKKKVNSQVSIYNTKKKMKVFFDT